MDGAMGNAANLFDTQVQTAGNAGKSRAAQKKSPSKQSGLEFHSFLNRIQKSPSMNASAIKVEGKNLLIAESPKAEIALLSPAQPANPLHRSAVPQAIQLPKGSVEFDAEGTPRIKPEAYKKISALLDKASQSPNPILSEERDPPRVESPRKKEKSKEAIEEKPLLFTPLSGLEMHPPIEMKPVSAKTGKEEKTGNVSNSESKSTEAKRYEAKRNTAIMPEIMSDSKNPVIGTDNKPAETKIQEKQTAILQVSDGTAFETQSFYPQTPTAKAVKDNPFEKPVLEKKTSRVYENDQKNAHAHFSKVRASDNKESSVEVPKVKISGDKQPYPVFSETLFVDMKSPVIQTPDTKTPVWNPREEKTVEEKPKRSTAVNRTTTESPLPLSQPVGTMPEPKKAGMKSAVNREEWKGPQSAFQSAFGGTIKAESPIFKREELKTIKESSQNSQGETSKVGTPIEPQPIPQATTARMSKPVLLTVHPDDVPSNIKKGESKRWLLADGELMKQIEPTLSEKLAQSAQVLALEVQTASVDERRDGKEYSLKFSEDKNSILTPKSTFQTLEKTPSVTESGFQVLRNVEPGTETKKASETIKTDSMKPPKSENADEMKPLPAQNNKGQTPDHNGQFLQQQVKAQLTATALNNMPEKKPEPASAPKQPVQDNAPVQPQSQNAPVMQNHPPQSMTAAQTAQEVNPGSMAQVYSEQIAKLQETVSQQVVKGVQGSFGSERSHISIQLTPESLGKVVVQMTIASGQLVAQIQADKDSTRTLLERNLGTLRAAFDEQGIKVERLVIAKDTNDYNRQDLNREQSPERPRQSRGESDSKYSNEQKGEQGQNRQDNTRRNAYTWTDRLDARNYYF